MGTFNKLYMARDIAMFEFLSLNPGIMFRFLRCTMIKFKDDLAALGSHLLTKGLKNLKTAQLIELDHIVARSLVLFDEPGTLQCPTLYRVKNSKFYRVFVDDFPFCGMANKDAALASKVRDEIQREVSCRSSLFDGKELWVDHDSEGFQRQYLNRGRATRVPSWVPVYSSVGDRMPTCADSRVILFIYWVADSKIDIDLSVACFDSNGDNIANVSYNKLSFGGI
jgi:hypothetical protein